MPSVAAQLMLPIADVPIGVPQVGSPVGFASNATLATPEPESLDEAVTVTGAATVAPLAGAVMEPVGGVWS